VPTQESVKGVKHPHSKKIRHLYSSANFMDLNHLLTWHMSFASFSFLNIDHIY